MNRTAILTSIALVILLAGVGYFTFVYETPVPQESSVIDTSSWKTYYDPRYEFEIQYPPYFYLSEYDISSDIVYRETASSIFRLRSSDSGTIDFFVISKENWPPLIGIPTENLVKSYIHPITNKPLSLAASWRISESQPTITKEEVENILSTFKFSDTSSQWKPYKDLKGASMFRYPVNWQSAFQGWKSHIDTAHNFSFWYPDYLFVTGTKAPEGYSTSAISYTQYGSDPVGSAGGINVQVHPQALTYIPTIYQGDLPLSKAKTIQVDQRTVYLVTEGDAGCGGTSYYIPLTSSSYAELSMGDCDGAAVYILPDADTIINSFRFSSNPGPSPIKPAEGGVPVSAWELFSSKYFNLSFKVPPGYEVIDMPNTIIVSKGPYKVLDEKRDNSLLRLRRFDSTYTKASAEIDYRQWNSPVEFNTFTVDKTLFPGFYGHDKSLEGNPSTAFILFEKSSLFWFPYLPGNVSDQSISYLVSTLKFSK